MLEFIALSIGWYILGVIALVALGAFGVWVALSLMRLIDKLIGRV